MPEIIEILVADLVYEATESREQMCEEEIDSYEEYYGKCQSYTRESIHARAEGYAQENVGSINSDDLKIIEQAMAYQKASRNAEADEYDASDNDAEYELCVNATNEGTTWWLRKW